MPTPYVKPSSQELKTTRTLVVTVEGDPEFSHVGNIDPSAWMQLLGIPGVIVDTSTKTNAVKKSTEAIKPTEFLSKARQVFTKTLVETLQKSQHFDEVRVTDNINGYNNNFDAVLNIKIVNWGTRMQTTGSDVIIPFMDVNISMNLHRDNKLIWKEIQTVTDDTHHTLEDYKRQKGLFEDDFTALVNKAGKQVATLLLDF